MRQTVSGPAAGVLVLLALAGFFVAFNRARPAPEPEPATVLPWSPPVDQQELQQLRKGLLPLGIRAVMPPLADDRLAGVRVALVVPGSVAARAGLQAGDLVKSFNGADTLHPFALVAALERVDPEKPNEAVLVRAGEERKVVIEGIHPLPPEERVR